MTNHRLRRIVKSLARFSQCGEDKLAVEFFGGKRGGFLVDVGAYDGVTNSNSRLLIEHFDWHAILIEPDPREYAKLKALYAHHPRVTLLQQLIAAQEADVPFYLSSRTGGWSSRVRDHGMLEGRTGHFLEAIELRSRPLTEVLHSVP